HHVAGLASEAQRPQRRSRQEIVDALAEFRIRDHVGAQRLTEKFLPNGDVDLLTRAGDPAPATRKLVLQVGDNTAIRPRDEADHRLGAGGLARHDAGALAHGRSAFSYASSWMPASS